MRSLPSYLIFKNLSKFIHFLPIMDVDKVIYLQAHKVTSNKKNTFSCCLYKGHIKYQQFNFTISFVKKGAM